MKAPVNYLILLFFLIASSINAQVTFIIEDFPEDTPPDDLIYIVGNFNEWNPGDSTFALALNTENKLEIILGEQSEGSTIEFKFTRGDWGTVEKGANGEEIGNRTFTFGNGDSVYVTILNWADIAGGSTAADNVFIVDDNFYMPQLDRTRRVWIYLPQNYADNPEEKYPVLYMHDGQNVFDAFTSFAGEWEVDETLNELENQGVRVPIVVAIDNGGSFRIDEYTPWVNTTYGGGEGAAYIDFIIETLKPYIDENYRTLPERNHTGLMGSSLGGLISHFGVLEHQEVFSKAGIFSPSYWFSDSVWTFVQEMGKQEPMRLYQMTGGNEGDSQVSNTLTMHDSLLAVGFGGGELNTIIIPGGQHNEQLWRTQFEDAYLWLFADFITDLIEEKPGLKPLSIYPNPVNNKLYPNIITSNIKVTIKVFNIYGKTVLKQDNYIGNSIDVSSLNPGAYLILLQSADGIYRGKFIKL
jgi:predicted alpha/beta superfamily hydrolase